MSAAWITKWKGREEQWASLVNTQRDRIMELERIIAAGGGQSTSKLNTSHASALSTATGTSSSLDVAALQTARATADFDRADYERLVDALQVLIYSCVDSLNETCYSHADGTDRGTRREGRCASQGRGRAGAEGIL
jgi:hypothetical protein